MSTEPETEVVTEAPPVAEEPVEEEKPRIDWQYKREFGINTKMREAIKLAIGATESELTTLRRKLAKAQYGG